MQGMGRADNPGNRGSRWRSLFLLLGAGAALASITPLLLWGLVETRYASRIYSVPEVVSGDGRAVIVFGAAVRHGFPSTVLRDRLDAAIRLYQLGQVDRLILSGDGRDASYDEPATMARYVVEQGVPEEALILDRHGLRTYDTCYRARAVYGVERAVLVTQRFHLPRALFTCELLGLDVVGLSADRRRYRSWYTLRELAALTVAAWDVVVRPVPDGGLEP
ncbi:MAG: ElyC/SanA/YdcF family protein [Anaerolineae bacterium]